MNERLDEFKNVLRLFTEAVEQNDGQGLASLFTEDGTYHDGFYGSFTGREAIATMLADHFWGAANNFFWQMDEPVFDGSIGYARYGFSYVSTLPGAEGKPVFFEGISQFTFANDLIKDYREQFNTGAALVQLGFDSTRIVRHLQKKAAQFERF